ncbi:transposase family protein [Caballeronia mineralivorans]|uniref:transposase family protein n=1 Tax=Caballeronia mineralivorans TaxID=2010198 RepID=UPI001364BFBB|nr:transposase family protein [Caballeronia mineralivorans]
MDAFADLRDPRCRTCRYPLPEILFAALSTVLCGVEGWRVRTGNMSNTTRGTGGWKHESAA